jgi:hypothetical protein
LAGFNNNSFDKAEAMIKKVYIITKDRQAITQPVSGDDAGGQGDYN